MKPAASEHSGVRRDLRARVRPTYLASTAFRASRRAAPIVFTAVRVLFFSPFASASLLVGCAAHPEAESLVIDSSRYAEAFEAAQRVAHARGFTAELRDPRGGVIETLPALAPTLLEPWRDDGSTFDRRIEQTLTFERRRARFEFAPSLPSDHSGPDPLDPGKREDGEGPDLLGLGDAPAARDLTDYAGPLELHVVVVVELASSPGRRPDTWSHRESTQTRIIPPGDEAPLPTLFWTPVTRDHALERRLLGEVKNALGES